MPDYLDGLRYPKELKMERLQYRWCPECDRWCVIFYEDREPIAYGEGPTMLAADADLLLNFSEISLKSNE